jgi:glycosyltransferase involved in cell wall biosynthesis
MKFNNTSQIFNKSSEIATVSVVLPSYNERESIEEAIERTSNALGAKLLEIIIVDDDSSDRTWELVKNLNFPKVKLIHRTEEKGLASAIATGIEASKGEFIVWLDCDLGIAPELIPVLIENINQHDVVLGSRYVEGGEDLRSNFRALLSRLLNKFAQLLLGSHLKDYTSGFSVIRKSILNNITISRDGFGEYFIEFLFDCHRKGYKIHELGYTYNDRMHGISKSGETFFDILKVGKYYVSRILRLSISNNIKSLYITLSELTIPVIVLWRRFIESTKEEGIKKAVNEILSTLYYLIASPLYNNHRRKLTFSFLNVKIHYFCHWYNLTFTNERAVEIAIANHILDKFRGRQILEVGNVLSSYCETSHKIIDKYEKGKNVINIDIVDYDSAACYDLIVSISTLEHVGYDEFPQSKNKIRKAVKVIRNHLAEDGLCIASIPIGYNEHLKNMILNDELFDSQYFFERLTKSNKWIQTTKDKALMKSFNVPFPFANAVMIGVVGDIKKYL